MPPGVRTIHPRTYRSGASPVELFPIPTVVWLAIHMLQFLGRVPVFSAIGVLGTVLVLTYGWTTAIIAVALTALLWLSGRVLWISRRCGGARMRSILTDMTKARWIVRQRWPRAAMAAGVMGPGGLVPPLRRLQVTGTGVTARVRVGRAGRTVQDLEHGSDAVAAVTGATSCEVEQLSPGEARLVLSWRNRTERPVTLADLPASSQAWVTYGVGEEGEPASLSLATSALFVGQSGSGKSNLIWCLLAGLLRQRIPFRLRIIDPAGGIELGMLKDSPFTHAYAHTAKEGHELLESAYKAMMTRAAVMEKEGRRLHTPTETEPLDITIIDELLLMSDQLRQGSGGTAGGILAVGRKTGYLLWGCSQLGQKDVLKAIRDLFPQRVCMAVTARGITDAVLGPSAESEGARCSRIPSSLPGVGYSYLDTQRGFKRFRSAEVPDSSKMMVAEGQDPYLGSIPTVPKVSRRTRRMFARKTAVYRFYDEDDRCLYVGITNNPDQRFRQHAESKHWWERVKHSRTLVMWYANRMEAEAAEEHAIVTERPLFNIEHAVVEGSR